MNKVLFLIVSLSCLLIGVTNGDWGSIPFKKGTQVTEPLQDAIIAWNGKEQLLYLQTTLAASEPGKVLEVMPLPGKPTIKEAQKGVFKRVAFLLPPPALPVANKNDPFGGPAPKAAEVVEQKIIGAHQIKVVKLLDPDAFTSWVKTEFGKIDIPAELLKVIGEYADDGFTWFIFDVVDLEQAKRKKTPLQIRFSTDHLYYPMRITRTEKGKTEVNLSIVTTVLFGQDDCVGIPRESIEVPFKPIEIPGNKVFFIDPPIFHLLGAPKTAKLRSWKIKGDIDSFTQDLLIRNPVKVVPR